MHYSVLTLATLLAQSQAQLVPMPFGMGPVAIPQGTNQDTNGQGNIGGMGNIPYASSMAPQISMAPIPTPMSSSMMPQRPAQSQSFSHGYAYSANHHYHYHMTPVASPSHYVKHMSMQASATMSVNIPNHALHAPHPHEGFNIPKPPSDIPQAPDFTSQNGASSHAGGYSGGNGNGFTETHPDQDNNSDTPVVYSDGSEAPVPDMGGIMDPNMGMERGSSIAPVDSMKPGTNVAPVQPQKSHGADLGNAFCMGDCYQRKEDAKCQKPYTSPVFQDEQGCYSCCFTSPDFK
ncbi:hypothetical protein N7488_003641 [Penicillium malachiteum]|nr:hypothetical protein N7488_003641 [Penicillium malachiteum]